MKKVWISLLAAILLLMGAFPAYAATQEQALGTIDKKKDIVIWVSWDVEEPQITFIAPGGKKYDPKVKKSGTTAILSDKNLYYVIKSAAAGDWRVRFDKGKNTELEISVHDYQEGISIQGFTIGKVEDGWLPFRFKVKGDKNVRFNYRIGAMIDHLGEEKVLTEGVAATGEEQDGMLNLNNLSTYSKYMLRLCVWYDDNGTDIFDVAFSEKFSYTNPNVDDSMTDFSMTIQPNEKLVDVAWPNAGWGADSILVAIFEGDGTEPAAFDEYETDRGSVQLSYDPAATKIRVELTPKYNGVSGKTLSKTVKPSTFKIGIPNGQGFNTKLLPLTYKKCSKQLVAVTVNGHTTELVLNGDGKANVTLGEDWNDVEIVYADKNGVSWLLQRKIFIDCLPPVLTMSRVYDGMTVQDTEIVISGTATECAALTINGKEVPIKDGNMFAETVSLSTGENVITVIAADDLGNKAQYVVAITCGFSGSEENAIDANDDKPGGLLETLTGYGSYWVLLIASVPCLLLIGYALLFWRKGGKANDEKESE